MSDYLEMPPGPVWELEGKYDPTAFFEALRLFADDGRLILYVEGPSREIREKLRPFEAESTNLVHPGTTWPESPKMHLRLTPPLIDKLIAISETESAPEYAQHVVLYGKTVVLEAYDFTDIPYHISKDVTEDTVEKFTRISGNRCRSVTV